MIKSIIALLFFSTLVFSSCSNSKGDLKVAATAIPHAEMLEYIKPDLAKKGIDLTIIVTDDYNLPNRALADKDVDANFFQHVPFMNSQAQEFSYPIESIASIEIEPMGIYSKKIHALSELRDKALIALPNDPTNEARALILLQREGLITLDNSANLQATITNIVSNPKLLQFLELDAAMLPRTLQDVDAAIITTNYALAAGLTPQKDALAIEDKDSPYANVLVVRIGEENRPDIQALKEALTSETMRQFILKTYHGAVLPAF